MKFTYYVPVEVSLPSKTVRRLEKIIREKWDMNPGSEVNSEDILLEAEQEKLIEPLPDGYRVL